MVIISDFISQSLHGCTRGEGTASTSKGGLKQWEGRDGWKQWERGSKREKEACQGVVIVRIMGPGRSQRQKQGRRQQHSRIDLLAVPV